MRFLSTLLIGVLVFSAQAQAFNRQTPFKFKGIKPLTYNGQAVKASNMMSILKKQKSKMSAKMTRADWQGLYGFRVTVLPEQGGEVFDLKIPLLSSASFPGSPAKDWEGVLLQMPVSAVVGSESWVTEMLPWAVTPGQGHEGFDIYVGFGATSFYYYRMAINTDQTGDLYIVESLSGEPKELKVATLELTGFTAKSALNLEISAYDYELNGAGRARLASDECGQSFKGEVGFVKFPEAISASSTAYAWQNSATDGTLCSLYFGGSPIGPRSGTLKAEDPGFAFCKGDGGSNNEPLPCAFGEASEMQFAGEPAKTNLIMKIYLTKVYQPEFAASISLIKR